MDITDKIKNQIAENNILIYMKGTPYEPKCGFSSRAVQALIECEAEFSFVDVLLFFRHGFLLLSILYFMLRLASLVSFPKKRMCYTFYKN